MPSQLIKPLREIAIQVKDPLIKEYLLELARLLEEGCATSPAP